MRSGYGVTTLHSWNSVRGLRRDCFGGPVYVYEALADGTKGRFLRVEKPLTLWECLELNGRRFQLRAINNGMRGGAQAKSAAAKIPSSTPGKPLKEDVDVTTKPPNLACAPVPRSLKRIKAGVE